MISISVELARKTESGVKYRLSQAVILLKLCLEERGVLPERTLMGVTNMWASKVTKYRAEQFLNDFCSSGGMLFCKFCHYNVDWKCGYMCKGHMRYKSQRGKHQPAHAL